MPPLDNRGLPSYTVFAKQFRWRLFCGGAWLPTDRRGCHSYWSWGPLAQLRMQTTVLSRSRLSTSTYSPLAAVRFFCVGELATPSLLFLSCSMILIPIGLFTRRSGSSTISPRYCASPVLFILFS